MKATIYQTFVRNTIPWKIDCESSIPRSDALNFLHRGFSVDNNSKILLILSSCFLLFHFLTTFFVYASMFEKYSYHKDTALMFSILREVLFVLLCAFSFLLLSKMKWDIDDSSSRLDWADKVKGCTD